MQFTIQDIAKFFINPLIPAFFFLIIQLMKKKQSRLLLLLILFYLYAVTIPLTSKITSRFWSIDDTVNYTQNYEAVVVLTGMANSSWYLGRRNNPSDINCYYRFGKNIDRIIAAAELIKAGHAEKLLFGDLRNKSFSEAELVVDFLEQQGIYSEQIIIYGEVKNTMGEAIKTREYAEETGLQKLVLVTSENHMRRAEKMFNDQGLFPDLLSVSRGKQKISLRDFIPGRNGLSNTQEILYEIVGYTGYVLTRMLVKNKTIEKN